MKVESSGKPACSVIAARGLAAKQSLGSDKTVLCIVCFVYSLLSLVVVILVLVFPLLSCQTVFISTDEFPHLSISPHHPAGGEAER